ncbi:unnamed protein product [Sphagnum balticum]|jgi:hypothetical protein
MALHFVSTSVLTSENGIDFTNELQLETEEARKARQDRDRASAKPLFAQLAEQLERQQEARDEVTRLIFSPPKALDDDEYE